MESKRRLRGQSQPPTLSRSVGLRRMQQQQDAQNRRNSGCNVPPVAQGGPDELALHHQRLEAELDAVLSKLHEREMEVERLLPEINRTL